MDDNSIANLENKVEDIENNDFEEEYQPESPESCTSDEDLSTSDEEYEPNEPQKKSQSQKRISKKPAKYQSTDEEYHTSESETEEQTEKRRVHVVKPQILHIGCSLCSMKIQAPLDGHTIPMVNSRFWTR